MGVVDPERVQRIVLPELFPREQQAQPRRAGALGRGFPVRTSNVDVLDASFSRENELMQLQDPRLAYFPEDEDYSVFRDDPLPSTYQPYWRFFVNSNSRRETIAIKAKIDSDLRDLEVLEAAPWYVRLKYEALASVASPSTLLPAAKFAQIARLGKLGNVAKFVGGKKAAQTLTNNVLAEAAATATAVGISELILQTGQTQRPIGESLLNVGTGTLLGGLLGVPAHAIGFRRVAQFEKMLDFEARVGMLHENISQRLPPFSEFNKLSPDAKQTAFMDAIRQEDPDFARVLSRGTMRKMMQKRFMAFSPVGRTTFQDDSPTLSAIAFGLAEVPFVRKDIEGLPVQSAETGAALWYMNRAVASADVREVWAKYRGAEGSQIPNEEFFSELVTLANRRDEKARGLEYKGVLLTESAAIEAVEEAARVSRGFKDSITDLGLSQGHFSKVDLQDTAASWVTRVFDLNRIQEDRTGFEKVIARWLREKRGFAEVASINEAKAIVSRIEGSPGKRIPYELVKEAGPFKERLLLIEDELIEPWLVNDVHTIMERLAFTVAPDLELYRVFAPAVSPRISKLLDRLPSALDSLRAGDDLEAQLLHKRTNYLRASGHLSATLRKGDAAAARELEGFMVREEALSRRVQRLEQRALEEGEAAAATTKDVEPTRTEVLRPDEFRVPKEFQGVEVEEGSFTSVRVGSTGVKGQSFILRGKRASGIDKKIGELKLLPEGDELTVSFVDIDPDVTGHKLGKLLYSHAFVRAEKQGKRIRSIELSRAEDAEFVWQAMKRAGYNVEKEASGDWVFHPKDGAREGQLDTPLSKTKAELETVGKSAQKLVARAAKQNPEVVVDLKPLKTSEKDLEASILSLEDNIGAVRRQNARRAVDLEGPLAKADQEFKEKEAAQKKAGQNRAAKATAKRRERRIADVRLMRDRLRNLGPPRDPTLLGARMSKSMRDLNFVRMLGNVVPGSVPDVAMITFVNGLGPHLRAARFAFDESIENIFRGVTPKILGGKPEKLLTKAAEKERITRMVVMLELAGGSQSRLSQLGDIVDDVLPNTAVERGISVMADMFAKATLLDRWNAYRKGLASLAIADRIIRDSINYSSLGRKAKENLLIAGIGANEAKAIVAQFNKRINGQKVGQVDGGLHLGRSQLWDDPAIREIYERAVVNDVRRTVVTPSIGDMPALMDEDLGRLLLQFKSFSISATNKVLASGLQRADAAVMSSVLLFGATGFLSYWSRLLSNGQELPEDRKEWAINAVDRSGLFGFMFDIDNAISRLSFGNIGINPMLVENRLQRFAPRNFLDLLGPSAGTFEDVGRVGFSLSGQKKEFTQRDLKRLSRFFPGESLFYLRWGFSRLRESIAEEYRLPE